MTRDKQWTPEALALLGTDSDAAIAKKLGKEQNAVAKQRIRYGIASYQQQKRWTSDQVALMGKISDAALGRQTGRSSIAVYTARRERGIPAYKPTHAEFVRWGETGGRKATD